MKQVRYLLAVPLLAALIMAVAGCGTSSSGTGSSGSSPQTLTVYAALTAANGTALAQAYQKYDPSVKVNMVTGGTGKLITRIQAEKQAGGVHADVLLLADPTAMPGLNSEQVLASFTPSAASSLPAGFTGTNWAGAFSFNNVIIYHKGMSLPVPQSWQDLTKSTYHNQIELGDPAYSGTTLGMAGYLSQQYGWSYFKDLKNNGATVVQSTNTVGTDVASGRVDVGISLDVVARDLIAKGSPVQIVWPTDGAIPVPAPVAIVAGHNTPASQKFVNWLLSSQGQQEVVKLGYAPAIGSSDLVPSGTKLVNVDWATQTSQRDQTLSQFKSIFPGA